MTLALIDYGAGNLHSVENALRAAGAADVAVTADPDVVARADRIVLPGVGAFQACMGALSASPVWSMRSTGACAMRAGRFWACASACS